MNAPPPALQAFQMTFGRRCRDPRGAPRPAGVPARCMAVYEELLLNNVAGFLDACFPVCRGLLSDVRWRRLIRAFFRDWRSRTPWFREIPREFLNYLATTGQPLPAWFRDLAHYEWVELAVDTVAVAVPPHDPAGDLMAERPLVNPTLMSLAYDWPVQHIGAHYRPRKSRPTHLLVFRHDTDEVRFAEINPVTARLLALVGEHGDTGDLACNRVAAELGHRSPAAIRHHGATLLAALRRQGAILGTRSCRHPENKTAPVDPNSRELA
jgi:uncharacterized protein